MGDTRRSRFADWVRRGVVGLARAFPWASARMGAAPRRARSPPRGRRRPAAVRWRDRAARVSPASSPRPRTAAPAVTLHTTRPPVIALADGDDTLVDAVLAGRVVLRGDVDDLAAFHDALMAFLQGAVRAPDFAATLVDFRAWQRRRDARNVRLTESPERHG